jgi:hypothetical protein
VARAVAGTRQLLTRGFVDPVVLVDELFLVEDVVLGGLLVGAIVVAGVFLRPARERVEDVEPVELQEAA